MVFLRLLISLILTVLYFPNFCEAFFGDGQLETGAFVIEKGENKPKYKEEEILVKFKPGVSEEIKVNLHRKTGSEKIKGFPSLRIHHIKLKKGVSVADAIGQYQSDPAVEYAEPNYILSALEIPNDPSFSALWGLHNTGQTGGTSGADIKAPEAWNITTGSNDVVVAVIDSGIDYTHPDLAANVWVNPVEINGNGIDDDANGYVDDVHGIDIYSQDSDPMDDFGHGTHVAGTIGAAGNNGIGVVGVNWNVKIMACKFLGAGGSGDIAGAITCLQYIKMMKDKGVNIVATNNSWGGGGYSNSLYDAINAQREILFIAAAGNDNQNNETFVSFPASYDLPNIISVAATDSTDSKAYFSNYGRRAVHVGAPGVDTVSLRASGTDMYHDGNHFIPEGDPNALYYRASGTSMATPHVTGLAALLKAQDMNRDWKDIRNLILSGGDSISSMKDTTITGKRINAYGSLTCSDQTVFAVSSCPSAIIPGIPVTLSAVSINCDSPVGTVTVRTAPGETITLHDDGIAPDLAVGDGIFTGTWIPSEGGEWLEFTFSSPFGTSTETVFVQESPLDAVFNTNADAEIFPIALQADGKILIGGNFFHINDVAKNFFARVNADGSLDTSFNLNTGGTVTSIVAQEDGKILIGGANVVKRLNPDGSLDTSFNANAGGTVESIVVQTDGKILVGGFFQSINGVTRNRIARLNADGALDTSFNPDANSFVMSMAVQTDGKILIGGHFTAIGGFTRNGMARLNADGSLDHSFNASASNASASGDIQSIAVQADGKILVGGYFTAINGVTRTCMARLNADGTLDKSFYPMLSGDVWSIVVQADEKILIGGSFTSIGGVTCNKIARLNADGSLDTSFNPNANSTVMSIAVQADGKILIGGYFTAIGGIARNRISRLNSDTEAVEKLTVDPDGTTITWMRGGASPEVYDVIFEQLINGNNWAYLGAATRISGGWRLTGISLNGTGSIRARGKSYGGYCNASTSLIESVEPYAVRITYTFNVIKTGTGTGAVTGPGINCGTDCGEQYISDTTVTLTATADPGSIFAGWSGDCNVSGEVTMTGVKTCTATFTRSSIQLSSSSYSVNENSGIVTITATRTVSSGEMGVSYATANGTAIAGSDYTAVSGTLNWADGDTANKTFTVSITNDTIAEANETFTVTLSNPTGGALLGSPSSATVAIPANDISPSSTVLKLTGISETASWFTLIQSAYDAAVNNDRIFMRTQDFNEDLNLNRSISVTLVGGCDASFNPVAGSYTAMNSLTITQGTVTVDHLVISNLAEMLAR